ncbi:uncharacterized protein LOC126377611 isoform X3 [Pectinophora gossypiella]|uniref:uncharacterized protein LOC126377611 isoform X3 n=1 Tax=Pectinophora gossypiella TaxID=13191 RepID=UPI00214F0781|nr:uncharacterized protein LOC126377611 isoform X3 [Pectinophora gossypiella]
MDSESAEDVTIEVSMSFMDIFWTLFFFSTVIIMIVFLTACVRMLRLGQKTRVPQERRMYVGSRPRQSFAQQEPTIFVSPANLPPPPKYEAMAPPSYEEVVGIHYPNYQASALPITQPITSAMAQSSRSADNNVTNNANTDATVITVTADDRRTSVTVTASS